MLPHNAVPDYAREVKSQSSLGLEHCISSSQFFFQHPGQLVIIWMVVLSILTMVLV